ncbi:zinc finger CCCH-type with G patch domain-containing protein isoform X2 [Nerophis ophidion]|uniref:zinc finger CCCH-type with G patch domain-containing protein isoform X2 n=1 Tax=Nerophis ophidion TaxID=159077 RepID=UPI002ADF0CDC|nr:zinc finger CCCH-type with G patch domain-containing protein isoform X2 [Nerophis ophidion]
MDEVNLEAAITTYEAQLQQVDATLAAGLDPSQMQDLLKLRADLCQLMELTKASFLSFPHLGDANVASPGDAASGASPGDASGTSLRNANRAPMGDANGASPGGANGAPADTQDQLESQFAAFYSELGESSGTGCDMKERDQESDEEEEETLSGTKVRAPYRTAWGTLEYHNAMVVGAEAPDGDEAQVRVLYIYPTQKSMKPCPFYLEDKCRFPDNCRFSHGEVVYVSELRDFLDCDLSNLEKGSSCLARHEDSIWYPARITDVQQGFYTVKFDSLLLKDAVMEADCIIPPLREEDPPSSDSDRHDEDDDEEQVVDAEVSGQEVAAVATSCFGGWEVHTRGIGSKLMLKMGYEYGKGLGKAQTGRVEPVLPRSDLLDRCGQLTSPHSHSRRQKDGGQPTGQVRRRRKPRSAGRERHTVFDFLNHKLGDKKQDEAQEKAALGGVDAYNGGVDTYKGGVAAYKGGVDTYKGGVAAYNGGVDTYKGGVDTYKGGVDTKRSLNIKLFQAAQKVAQTQKEIHNLTQALRRHTGRSTVKQLEEKLSMARQLLTQQKAQELSIQKEHSKLNTHKKMTHF